jgi:hypothetical protein
MAASLRVRFERRIRINATPRSSPFNGCSVEQAVEMRKRA